jgi:hypothetical protein
MPYLLHRLWTRSRSTRRFLRPSLHRPWAGPVCETVTPKKLCARGPFLIPASLVRIISGCSSTTCAYMHETNTTTTSTPPHSFSRPPQDEACPACCPRCRCHRTRRGPRHGESVSMSPIIEPQLPGICQLPQQPEVDSPHGILAESGVLRPPSCMHSVRLRPDRHCLLSLARILGQWPWP